jgi:hypothetical protein
MGESSGIRDYRKVTKERKGKGRKEERRIFGKERKD